MSMTVSINNHTTSFSNLHPLNFNHRRRTFFCTFSASHTLLLIHLSHDPFDNLNRIQWTNLHTTSAGNAIFLIYNCPSLFSHLIHKGLLNHSSSIIIQPEKKFCDFITWIRPMQKGNRLIPIPFCFIQAFCSNVILLILPLLHKLQPVSSNNRIFLLLPFR